MNKKETITVQGTEITIISMQEKDYICITDIAKYKSDDPTAVIANWMRNRNTVEFLGVWESLYNPNFKPLEFEGFRKEAGLNAFTLSPQKWIDATHAIGLVSKSGRYGGTYAHKDIAFKFASWISIEFELFVVKEFQRMKEDEQRTKSLEWNLQRTLSKINYRIHTDAIREEIIPKTVTKEQAAFVYANEADLLNVALFGKTAAQWRGELTNEARAEDKRSLDYAEQGGRRRSQNPAEKGNIRDFATLEQLVVLSNMESINALLIRQGLPQGERLVQLNRVAITQMKSLVDNQNLTKRLK
jgi:hypothetical protein